MRISGDFNDGAEYMGDDPEIDALVRSTQHLGPEFPCRSDSGHDLALGLAIWRSDGHLDTPGDIQANE